MPIVDGIGYSSDDDGLIEATDAREGTHYGEPNTKKPSPSNNMGFFPEQRVVYASPKECREKVILPVIKQVMAKPFDPENVRFPMKMIETTVGFWSDHAQDWANRANAAVTVTQQQLELANKKAGR